MARRSKVTPKRYPELCFLVRCIILLVNQTAYAWWKILIYFREKRTRLDLKDSLRYLDEKMNNSDNELSRRVIIANDLGLHARSASKIVKLVQNAKFNVWIIKDEKKADASSIIDILTLASPKGSTITVKIDDRSDLEILNNLVQLIENGFGE